MKKIALIVLFLLVASIGFAKDTLRIFTWEGYVTNDDLKAVNKILEEKGYDIEAKIIEPYAMGPEQMFEIIRGDKCDVSFLTLNYIKMQGGKTAQCLQAININSPRLKNYEKLRKELVGLEMGMQKNDPLYIPFGGGAYGIWANMKKLKKEELPTSVKELWDSKWKGKISLTSGQIQPNIALVMLAMDKSPFYLNDIMISGKREDAIKFAGEAQNKTDLLYKQVKSFWDAVPVYSDDLLLVAGYGLEIAAENAKGGKWEFVKFKEGSTV